MAFKPGQSGNPGGVSPKKPITDALRGLLSRRGDDLLSDKPATIAQKLALDMAREAIAGDTAVRQQIIDRVEGKPAQALIGGDEGDSPLAIVLFKRTIVDPLKPSE